MSRALQHYHSYTGSRATPPCPSASTYATLLQVTEHYICILFFLKACCLLILFTYILIHAWIYHHFQGIGGEEYPRYEEHQPRVRKFILTRGQARPSSIRKSLYRLLPHDTDWACYEEHQQICPLQPISLYSSWIYKGLIPPGEGPSLVWLCADHSETSTSLRIRQKNKVNKLLLIISILKLHLAFSFPIK
jgi:hypothetical protein